MRTHTWLVFVSTVVHTVLYSTFDGNTEEISRTPLDAFGGGGHHLVHLRIDLLIYLIAECRDSKYFIVSHWSPIQIIEQANTVFGLFTFSPFSSFSRPLLNTLQRSTLVFA